jgi:hypothetical protein
VPFVDGGTDGSCGGACNPSLTCSNGHNCGIEPDGCGGTVSCGACSAPATCQIPGGGTSGTCGEPPCAAFNAGGACTSTEQAFVNKSTDCYECLVSSDCLDNAVDGISGLECEDLTGNATAGAKAGTPKSALCLSLLDCVLATSCASTDITGCYCGSLGFGSACAASTGTPDGACAQAEVDGAEDTLNEPVKTVFNDLFNLPTASGVVNQIYSCGKANQCSSLCAQ